MTSPCWHWLTPQPGHHWTPEPPPHHLPSLSFHTPPASSRACAAHQTLGLELSPRARTPTCFPDCFKGLTFPLCRHSKIFLQVFVTSSLDYRCAPGPSSCRLASCKFPRKSPCPGLPMGLSHPSLELTPPYCQRLVMTWCWCPGNADLHLCCAKQPSFPAS